MYKKNDIRNPDFHTEYAQIFEITDTRAPICFSQKKGYLFFVKANFPFSPATYAPLLQPLISFVAFSKHISHFFVFL